jgi:hypothetical protein
MTVQISGKYIWARPHGSEDGRTNRKEHVPENVAKIPDIGAPIFK